MRCMRESRSRLSRGPGRWAIWPMSRERAATCWVRGAAQRVVAVEGDDEPAD